MKKSILTLGLLSCAATLQAQTNSINISSSQQTINPTTTFNAWKVTAMSADMQNALCYSNTTTSGAPPSGINTVAPVSVGQDAKVITTYPSWPSGNFLSCYPFNTIYTTKPVNLNSDKCTMTIQRRFYVCSKNSEQVNVNLSASCDDFVGLVTLDGNTTLYSNTSTTGNLNPPASIATTQTLTPGMHTIEIVCGNQENPYAPYYPVNGSQWMWNPFGVSLNGTITSVNNVLYNAMPTTLPAITGNTTVCSGQSNVLSNAAAGGTWSSNTSVATVSSSGAVTGVNAGNAIITYTNTQGNYCPNNTSINVTVQNCCSDTCYWKVQGNNILNGNNIFGTLTKDNIRIQTTSTDRGILTSDGKFGWNTMTPTAFLHVNCKGNNPDNGSAGTSDIRFESLESGGGSLLLLTVTAMFSGVTCRREELKITVPMPILFLRLSIQTAISVVARFTTNGTSVGIGSTTPRTFTGVSALTAGSIPAGTVATLDVNGSTYTNTLVVSSDARFKKNIQTIQDPLTIINKLNGVSYDWNREAFSNRNFDQLKQAGFIAQDVEKVYPQAVVTDKDGYYALNYNMFIPLLNNGVKVLYDLYQEEKSENEQMRNDIKLLQARLDALNGNNNTGINTITVLTNGSKPRNAPNPFSNETKIEFYIASMNSNAYIMVYDLNGKELKRMPITAAGKGFVMISGGDLQSGMYIYSLIIDGREIDSKRMTLIK